MHPDYLDYVQKQRIHAKAQWHDIKFLCRKLTGCELRQVYVARVDYNDWCGWVAEFNVDVDISEIRRTVDKVVVVGDRAVFIGVSNG